LTFGGISILRVISGEAKGHKLKTVKGNTTRPTTDRVKESLFNIIAGFVGDAEVLDLFAGTGNLGIEALSRGANSAVFVDKSRECSNVILENLTHTRLLERSTIITSEVGLAISRLANEGKRFSLIFLDPPYNKNFVEKTLNYISKSDIILDNGLIVAEHDYIDSVPESIDHIKLLRSERYGDTVISFFRKSILER
jgi:16S rRNA (guanine(966)-N(2))-methyltransferase RsmD